MSLVFTEAAAQKVQSLIDEEQNPELKLRVYISGGGCSGFQYGFTFVDEVAEDDHVTVTSIHWPMLNAAEARKIGKRMRLILLLGAMDHQARRAQKMVQAKMARVMVV